MARGWRFPSVLRYCTDDIYKALKDPNARIILYVLTVIICIATFLLALNLSGTTYEYSIGDISQETIRVPRDIHYRNEEETGIIAKQASQSVPLVFDKDALVVQEKLRIATILFNSIKNAIDQNPPQNQDEMITLLAILKSRYLPRYLHYNDKTLIGLLRYPDQNELKKITSQILIYIYDNRDKPLPDEFRSNNNITIRTINASEQIQEYSRTLDSLITPDNLSRQIYGICRSFAPNLQPGTLNSLVTIVTSTLQSNISFNQDETSARIEEKTKLVKPVMEVLKKGQTIIREGDTVTSEVLKRLEILNRQAHSSSISYILGVLLIQTLFLAIFGYFILRNSHYLVPDRESTLILGGLVLLFMIYTFFLGRTEIISGSRIEFALLLPVPFMTMIVALLYNSWLANLIGLNVIFFTTFITGGDFDSILISFSSALMGLLIVGRVERRSDFLRGGFIMGLINALLVMGISLMHEVPFRVFHVNMQLAIAHGLINSILVMGLIPLFENLFGITTRFKLLELSDLNADIFKRMLLEAPGTYNHSLLVSTMAEAACQEINGNHLLARVGAFYHDIGKIDDAGMFIENRISDPRAKVLSPTEYSQLIISHVRKGVDLARKYDLPESVIDFIREHHGKSTMSFFYHQALEEADREDRIDEVNKSSFQYPGPKPHSRETAIVMLADTIEAASRSIKEPSYAKLEGLVTKIIFNKLNEGDLEMSDLTMSELTVIKNSFIKILTGIFHTRIEYPEQADLKKLESKAHREG